MDENCDIRMTKGVLARNLRAAYYGGIVSVFKKFGKKLFGLDVNSLYPFAMLGDMPVGTPKFVVNPTESEFNSHLGFFYAEIECPEDVKYPTLPYKDPQRGLICPRGN